jgi:hypothetical protein
MDGKDLLSRTIVTIQEMYLKIGNPSGSVSLYYPYEGDFDSIRADFTEASKDSFPNMVLEELPKRLRVTVSEKDCVRISEMPVRETIRDISSLIGRKAGIEEIMDYVSQKYPSARFVKSQYIDFDWLLLFPRDQDEDV